MANIRDNIFKIRQEIASICPFNAGDSSAVTLLAASKSQPESAIREAIAAGISDFGENRVQEAQDKWPSIKRDFPHVRLHLIGPLQTNKVRDALALFDVIQTVDRLKLAEALAAELPKSAKACDCYIQVNTGEEAQKAGIAPHEADGFIEDCRNRLHLPITGLMCVPPQKHPPAPHFALLHAIAGRHGLHKLSMGMSEDYVTAVRMGSTCVRVGTALFGARVSP